LTEHERNVRLGLRAVRRVYRRADTQGERLERILRRLYLRKTVPRTVNEVQSMLTSFYLYRDAVRDLEQTLANDYVRTIES
jgi:glutamate-1-semialdehyde aminotransferase